MEKNLAKICVNQSHLVISFAFKVDKIKYILSLTSQQALKTKRMELAKSYVVIINDVIGVKADMLICF